MLEGKKILLGITGGIAAYKIPLLVRLYKKAGAEVKIIQTPASLDFVSPLVLSTLSGNPVVSHTISEDKTQWNNHVELALWADLMIIAPATANTLAKMAQGICDNLLLATYLSAKCPIIFVPAMDLDMYQHPSFLRNRKTLLEYGNIEIPAEEGFLASGLVGKGRMAEPETIYWKTVAHFSTGNLSGKKVLINAGPTYEAIDPVRFIGNRSTGKMGIALATEAALRGAEVTLVLGPSSQEIAHPNILVKRVESAQEMYEECVATFENVDLAILSAAVADFKVKNASDQKIKKKKGTLPSLEFELNPDILAHLGTLKKDHQTLVGFALETQNAIEYGKQKLVKKNLDFIVVNTLEDAGAGFGHDTNKVILIDKRNKINKFELKSKWAVAKDIFESINF
ncbi:MAG: bifunctional phosphopantothenoylcysteine decarboxylase/phosphopantothenate--cysteine ligase CoaBC [Flavobacteriales bacterium]|nr:bifunctional phosphopantothenoylcysteine decarboxylase/phosphopantothenate--cysteine ligase CoaBC [Flavobacteriales bacterium]